MEPAAEEEVPSMRTISSCSLEVLAPLFAPRILSILMVLAQEEEEETQE